MEVMSDEESFVILGTSPMASLEQDGTNDQPSPQSSLQSDTPGSRFSSLKNSQITELESARESSIQTPTLATAGVMEQSAESKLWSRPPMAESSTQMLQSVTASNLWSIPQVDAKGDSMPDSLEKSNSLKSSLKQTSNEVEKEPANDSLKNVTISAPSSLDTPQNSLKANGVKSTSEQNSLNMNGTQPSTSKANAASNSINTSLASSFIMGEVNADVLKLRKENQELKQSFEAQIEHTKALDVARQKDREDTIQEISEKNAVIENMRAQIVKLEKQQLATFEVIPKQKAEKTHGNFDDLYVTRGEHDLKVKDLERELSQLLASNLDMKDVEKQYVDELNCLKVNLTSAEEIINHNRAEIAELRALDADKQKKIEYLEIANSELRAANLEQNDRIIVFEQQNQVHRNNFEMERQRRETAVAQLKKLIWDHI